MNKTHTKQAVRFVLIDDNSDGQRIDNFLMRELKDVPRSYIYRILRKGEVRVNKKRIKPPYKLKNGDNVRIPPVFQAEKNHKATIPESLLKQVESAIINEDNDLIFINKPSGIAVHGGSGIKFGIIEIFRQLRPELSFVELVHRLDKETSGILMLAKNRQTLLELHQMMKDGGFTKYYQTLVKGEWRGGIRTIKNKLQRQQGRTKKVQVLSDDALDGKESISIFSPVSYYKHYDKHYTLLKVELITGRMHQIRTQLADLDHPVLGDSQYGDFSLNRKIRKDLGLKRLFLHAFHLKFKLKHSGKDYNCKIPLSSDLIHTLEKL